MSVFSLIILVKKVKQIKLKNQKPIILIFQIWQLNKIFKKLIDLGDFLAELTLLILLKIHNKKRNHTNKIKINRIK